MARRKLNGGWLDHDPGRLVLRLDQPHRGVSSCIVGGGVGPVRTWLNLQVPLDYARTDPVAHLHEEAAGLHAPVVATMTAAEVGDHVVATVGGVTAVVTVGLSVPLAAAGTLELQPAVGTINIAVVVATPLSDAGLVNAVQTATEAKAQALAECGITAMNHPGPATGTATDSILVCSALPPPGQEATAFAGPAAPVGNAIAHAVHRCMTEGTARWHTRRI